MNSMQYINYYNSPLGRILLSSDEEALTGLWFEGQKYYAWKLDPEAEEKENAVFDQTKQWLDVYFSERKPDFMPPLHLNGTEFQTAVWEQLLEIPYGTTVTYGELAQRTAEKRGMSHMSARVVGNAVGHNRISIIVPCHRVVGANGSLTGYAGGIERKKSLLALEKVNITAI